MAENPREVLDWCLLERAHEAYTREDHPYILSQKHSVHEDARATLVGGALPGAQTIERTSGATEGVPRQPRETPKNILDRREYRLLDRKYFSLEEPHLFFGAPVLIGAASETPFGHGE